MRLHRYKTYIALLIILTYSITGCSSNDLSRGKAKNLIQEAAKSHPIYVHFRLGVTYYGECRVTDDVGRKLNNSDFLLRGWKAAGYLTIRDMGNQFTPKPVCTLTDEGKGIFTLPSDGGGFRLKVGERVIVDIDGMKSNESVNDTNVSFTFKSEAIESETIDIGKIIMPQNDILPSAPRPGSAHFALYDDGWRIETLVFDRKSVIKKE